MPMYMFGSGTLSGVRTDVANSTPAVFGVVQNAEANFEFDVKSLMGQYQFPVAIARAGAKVSGKASFGQVRGNVFNDLFFGQTSANTGRLEAVNEAGTVPGSSAYTITVTNSATFLYDLGVFYASTGVQFTRVASSPAAGQYSVSAGVYTFAAADASTAVLLNYEYSVPSGSKLITINNQLMGSQPIFKMVLQETFQSKTFNLELNACVSGKLAMPLQNADFTITDMEWQAYADSAGVIGYLTTSE